MSTEIAIHMSCFIALFLAFTSHGAVTNIGLKMTLTLGHARHQVMLTKYKQYTRGFAVNQNKVHQLTLTR